MSILSRIMYEGGFWASSQILFYAQVRRTSSGSFGSNIQASMRASVQRSRAFPRTSFSTQSNPGSTVHKMQKVGLLIFGGATLLAAAPGPCFSEQAQPVALSKMQDELWVLKCVGRHPETLWLADAEVRKTEEGKATIRGSYSAELFGLNFPEFDRTMTTILCLRSILDGSDAAYKQFTQAQAEGTRLSRESFAQLHSQGMKLVSSNYGGMSELEITQAIEAALVLGDIGKSARARAIFQPYGANAPDHDDFYEEVMQILKDHPYLSPTFDRLPPAAKKLLQSTANFIHYGHVTHLEGGPSMFSKLKQSGLSVTCPDAVRFDVFVHTCDVSGAAGHVNNKSSVVWTESVHRAMQAVADACDVLTDPQKSEKDAYNFYLATRAQWLGLNPQDRTDRLLTRVGAMLRLVTPEDGRLLKQSFQKLTPDSQAKIIEQLDGEEFSRTPTYMPAVLANLSNHPQLGASREDRIEQAVILGLPFLSRVLAEHKQLLADKKANPDIPLNFNQAAGVAKQSPHALQKGFYIDAEGNVCCASK